MWDEHPELTGYVPLAGRPLRSARRGRVARIVVIVAVAALVLPGVVSSWMLAARTAAAVCRQEVQQHTVGASGSAADFELMGATGPGWYCYSTSSSGLRTLVAPLGIIPSVVSR